MEYLSLYRKYRPKKFTDVIGQDNIITILKNAIRLDKVANAYIFAGVRGTGKTSIAKIFANAINCLGSKDGEICQECEVCDLFKENRAIDVIELDAASNNGVDEVRDIIDKVNYLPAILKKKVYIIDEAHMLTTQAWNALLKTIEEPPAHVIFIFATTEVHKIPETILSRCQCFRFNKISSNEIVGLMQKICDKEKIKYEVESLNIVAQVADGSVRDALSTLEQVAIFSNNNIKVENVEKIYGLLSSSQMLEFVLQLVDKKYDIVLENIKDLYQKGINFSNFCNYLLSIFTDRLLWLETKNEKLLLKLEKNQVESVKIDDRKTISNLINLWQDIYFKTLTQTDLFTTITTACIKSIDLLSNNILGLLPNNDTKIQSLNNDVNVVVHKQKSFFKATRITQEVLSKTKNNFEHNDRVKEIKLEEKFDKKIEKPSISLSNNELLFSCAANRNKDVKEKWKEYLSKIKDSFSSNNAMNYYKNAKKVFCASKNIVVLEFSDELDARLANKKMLTKEILLECCRELDQPFYIVCFSTQQLLDLQDEGKEKMKQKLDEPNLDKLREIMNDSIQQKAFNLIYKKVLENE